MIIQFLLIIPLVLIYYLRTIKIDQNYYYYDDNNNITSVNKLAKIFKKLNYTECNDISLSKYILHCGRYSKFHDEYLPRLLNQYNDKVFFTTPNNWIIGNKAELWNTLKNYYGIHNASQITPYTYLLPQEYNKYINEYNKDTKFIFKTNQQRQEGLFVTNSKISLNMIEREKFIVAQKYLTNPLLFNGKKITFRLYLLLITSTNLLKYFVYHDGLMYYTKYNYNENTNIETDNISSFYDSTKLYDNEYPILLSQFTKNNNNKQMIENAKELLKKLVNAIKKPIHKNTNFKNNICAEIFGVDFFVDNQLNTHILECNIGPGMKSYSQNDDVMRNNLFKFIIEKITMTD